MLNWVSRYAPLGGLICPDGAMPGGGLLDVGSGTVGASCLGLGAPFVGVDIAFDGPVAPEMRALAVAPGPLPFCDRAFETVVSLDALEHVPRPDRAGFVSELIRVSASRVVLACPTDEAAAIDALLGRLLVALGGGIPPWLSEHQEHVLPSREEVWDLCALPGVEVQEVHAGNGLLSAALAVAEMLPVTDEMASVEEARSPEHWRRLLADARFGAAYRVALVLDRPAPRTAAIRSDDIDRTLVDALRCPGCTSAVTGEHVASARCDACGWATHGLPSGVVATAGVVPA